MSSKVKLSFYIDILLRVDGLAFSICLISNSSYNGVIKLLVSLSIIFPNNFESNKCNYYFFGFIYSFYVTALWSSALKGLLNRNMRCSGVCIHVGGWHFSSIWDSCQPRISSNYWYVAVISVCKAKYGYDTRRDDHTSNPNCRDDRLLLSVEKWLVSTDSQWAFVPVIYTVYHYSYSLKYTIFITKYWYLICNFFIFKFFFPNLYMVC